MNAGKEGSEATQAPFDNYLLDKIPLGVCIADAHKILWVNEPFCRLFSCSRKRITGQALKKLFRHAVIEKLWHEETFSYNMEYRDPPRTDELLIRSVCIRDKRGNKKILICAEPLKRSTHVLVSIDDITAEKQLEERIIKSEQQLLRKNNELKSLNSKLLDSYNRIKQINAELKISRNQALEGDQLKSAFLANLSHEIRTPLNGILGFLELLEETDPDSPQRERYTSIINSSADQLLNTINDVLEVSKIETDQVDLTLSDIHLNNLLREIYTVFEVRAQARKLQLNLKLGSNEEDCVIYADEGKLRQVLNNLLNNALKFTSEGSVEFGYTRRDDHREFYVKDTGIGIEADMKNNIFDHFRQVDMTDQRLYGGLGLGLPISKAWIRLQGGKIWLDSIPGKGTTFYFTLPDRVREESAEPVGLRQHFKRKSGKQQPTILVVEDEEYNMLFLKELLSKSGARILTATDGQEAIDICEREADIDLVLMDIKIPKVDGYTATRRIKTRHKDLPVIAQTALTLEDDRERALQAGCDAYIPKPVRKKDMMDIINRYL